MRISATTASSPSASRSATAGSAPASNSRRLVSFRCQLNLNIHFHALALDGVYTWGSASTVPRFHRLPPPTDADIAALLTRRCRETRRTSWMEPRSSPRRLRRHTGFSQTLEVMLELHPVLEIEQVLLGITAREVRLTP